MFRIAILGFTAAALVAVLAATATTTAFGPTAAPAGHYVHVQANKAAYVKGAMVRNCLGDQAECTLIVN
jgi:hypothetical protein